MPIGEDEAIAVGPIRFARIVAHDAAVQDVRQGSERHRCALVPTLGLQRRIHRHPAYERDGLLIDFRCESARHAVDCTRTVDFEPCNARSDGWQQREWHEVPWAAVDAAVGEDLAVVGKLKLAFD